MPDFSRRSEEEELMDDLSLSNDALRQNLDELETINRYLGGNSVVLDALDQLLPTWRRSDADCLRIADLGTGGGDLPRAITQWAAKRKVRVHITGIDANPFMIQYAQEKAKNHTAIEFQEADIFSPQFQLKQFDICICSLFCHHFSDEKLTELFRQMAGQSKIAFIINDLHRHPLAWYSIKFLTWLFRGSYLVRNDAPLSVLRAFRKSELEKIISTAGLGSYQLKWKWAFRYQLIVLSEKVAPEA